MVFVYDYVVVCVIGDVDGGIWFDLCVDVLCVGVVVVQFSYVIGGLGWCVLYIGIFVDGSGCCIVLQLCVSVVNCSGSDWCDVQFMLIVGELCLDKFVVVLMMVMVFCGKVVDLLQQLIVGDYCSYCLFELVDLLDGIVSLLLLYVFKSIVCECMVLYEIGGGYQFLQFMM